MFDLFNKRKLEEKEREISQLMRLLKERDTEIYKMREQEKTGHKTGMHCKPCENCIEIQRIHRLYGEYTEYACALDNDCKDYKPKT